MSDYTSEPIDKILSCTTDSPSERSQLASLHQLIYIKLPCLQLTIVIPANRKRYRNVSIWLQKGLVEANIVETLL